MALPQSALSELLEAFRAGDVAYRGLGPGRSGAALPPMTSCAGTASAVHQSLGVSAGEQKNPRRRRRIDASGQADSIPHQELPMYYPSDVLAKTLVEDRLREANHRRRFHEARRRELPSAAVTPRVRKTTRRVHFWNLVHVRHAHG